MNDTHRSIVVALVLLLIFSAGSRGESPVRAPIDNVEGRPQIAWQDAGDYVGRFAFVSGKVAKIGHAKGLNFVNFDENRRDVFKLLVTDEVLDAFPDTLEALYEGKNVRVFGQVVSFAGGPEIKITTPAQIEVLAELPELPRTSATTDTQRDDELTLATYNILNLYDDVDDAYHDDDTTPAKPRQQLEQVASVIREIDADVLALEEVENRGYLERFIEVFLPDMGYRHVVHFEGNDLRGSDPCLVSREPIGAVTSYRHLRFEDEELGEQRFRRDVIRVEILPVDGDPFDVWVVHLKSNHDGRNYAEPVRAAEARQIRALLDGALRTNPDRPFVVCGDFNDTEQSTAVTTITATGPLALRSFWETLPADERITFNREPYRSMIDFILFSPAMAERYVTDSYHVRLGSFEESGSDHNPVVCRVRRRR
ncbi:MAG: endonuclease/exonuclease/phosphatase family protein [Planctomycetales bacterium]|nr:endonuclease/exonuclease/phosphatase family protein [Planctomycetales bacterium]